MRQDDFKTVAVRGKKAIPNTKSHSQWPDLISIVIPVIPFIVYKCNTLLFVVTKIQNLKHNSFVIKKVIQPKR